jgi:hypothetical protein
MEVLLETVFAVGSTPSLYNKDPRPTELVIEKSTELVEGRQFSCEEKSFKSVAVKRRLYVSCSCSETVINPLPGYDK